jgi:hypothetical protein
VVQYVSVCSIFSYADIDECIDPELQEGGRCSVGCVNTLGSYQCVDLKDQASGNHLPSTESADTISSASAECSSGFKLGSSGSCIDIDECATNNGGCSHTCQNTLGEANCLCPPGFMLGNDWKTCKGALFFWNFNLCVCVSARVRVRVMETGFLFVLEWMGRLLPFWVHKKEPTSITIDNPCQYNYSCISIWD